MYFSGGNEIQGLKKNAYRRSSSKQLPFMVEKKTTEVDEWKWGSIA